MAQQWFYARGGQKAGPINSKQLRELITSGGLQPADLVWTEGMGRWKEARLVKGLFATAPSGAGLEPRPVPPRQSELLARPGASEAPSSGKQSQMSPQDDAAGTVGVSIPAGTCTAHDSQGAVSQNVLVWCTIFLHPLGLYLLWRDPVRRHKRAWWVFGGVWSLMACISIADKVNRSEEPTTPANPIANGADALSPQAAAGPAGVASDEAPKTHTISQAAKRPSGTISGKWGYIDKVGNIVLPGPFGYAGDFSDGFAVVGAGRAGGFLDKSGAMHFAGRFDGSGGFSGGEARVWKGEETFYIDRNGEPVRRHRLEIAQVGGKWGFKDEDGKFVINPQFDLVSKFSDGVSVVSMGKAWGIIDERGEYVLSLQSDKIINTFWRGGKDIGVSEGLLGYRDLNEAIEGYVNTRGKVVITARFSQAVAFSEGLAGVEYWVPQSVIERNWEAMKFDFEPRMGKYGYIDTKGSFVIAAQFDDAQPFSEGLAAVKVGKKDGKWGYIDRSGNFVIDPTYGETPAGFKDGLARIKVGELIGFINRNGKVAIEPQFLDASAFSEGLAAVKFR